MRPFARKVEGSDGEVEGLKSRHLVSAGTGVGLDYEALLERSSEQPLPAGDGDDLATLNFSGGTTGAPKAAMLRHRNLMTVARNTIHGFDIASDAVFLNVRPLWPIAQVILMSHLFAGATVMLGGRFDARRLAATIERNRRHPHVTGADAARALARPLAARDPRLERLQAVYVGGSRIPPPYSSGRWSCSAADRRALRHDRSAGDLLSAAARSRCEPATVGNASWSRSGARCPDTRCRLAAGQNGGRAGEVLIRGGNVMAGYWQDEAASQALLRDGWLHTGDIGELDDAGNLSIVGRLKDVIRSGSSTIMPKEVEDVIVLHPAVSEVAVIGLPDIEWGEAVTAFVVLKPGMAATEHDLVEHCRKHLAAYKKPRSVRFVADLPRSHYGKVIRSQLLAQGGELTRAKSSLCLQVGVLDDLGILRHLGVDVFGELLGCRRNRFESEHAQTLLHVGPRHDLGDLRLQLGRDVRRQILRPHKPYHDTNRTPSSPLPRPSGFRARRRRVSGWSGQAP